MKNTRFAHCLCLAFLTSASFLACDSSAPTPTTQTATSASAKAATPTASTKPASAPKTTGPFGPFADFMLAASGAAMDAARGKSVADKWNLQPLDPKDSPNLDGFEPALVIAEVEAIHAQHGYLRTSAYIFPDGSVRFVKLKHRAGAPTVQPSAGIAAAAPELVSGTGALIKGLSSDRCDIPLLQAGDKERLPDHPEFAQALRDATTEAQRTKVCAATKNAADGWGPRYDDIAIVAAKGSDLMLVRTEVKFSGGKLTLGTPQVRAMK